MTAYFLAAKIIQDISAWWMKMGTASQIVELANSTKTNLMDREHFDASLMGYRHHHKTSYCKPPI